MQAFFDENPDYFLAVNGEPPRPCEAQEEFDDLPPADMSFNERWLIGFTDPAGKLVGFAGVLSDILAARVWHIGIFIVASSLHGTGAASALYDTLERWMAANGAAWIRLGVVEGNVKAERFWRKTGYREVRKRLGIAMGQSHKRRQSPRQAFGEPFHHRLSLACGTRQSRFRNDMTIL